MNVSTPASVSAGRTQPPAFGPTAEQTPDLFGEVADLSAVLIMARLMAAGFDPGWPSHLKAETVLTDSRICRAMRCPVCHRRHMRAVAFHGPRSEYKLVAVCRCGAGEEV